MRLTNVLKIFAHLMNWDPNNKKTPKYPYPSCVREIGGFLEEILLRANEAEMKQNLNYVGRCEVFLGMVLRGLEGMMVLVSSGISFP